MGLDKETKQAWMDNWKEHGVAEVMEIFSYPRVRRLLDTVTSVLPRGEKVLEGGCGLGPWVIKLRSLGYDVTGVDYDPVSVAKIKKYDNSAPVYEADIRKMPFKDGAFGAYLSFGVLEHFPEGPAEPIREAWRVLKSGGCFFVMVPYMNAFLKMKYPLTRLRKSRALRKLFRREEKNFYYERYFGVKEIKGLLEEGGFLVERVFPADHIFSFVSFSGIFRDKRTYDGENRLAVRCADIFSKVFPWQTAGSFILVAKKIDHQKTENI